MGGCPAAMSGSRFQSRKSWGRDRDSKPRDSRDRGKILRDEQDQGKNSLDCPESGLPTCFSRGTNGTETKNRSTVPSRHLPIPVSSHLKILHYSRKIKYYDIQPSTSKSKILSAFMDLLILALWFWKASIAFTFEISDRFPKKWPPFVDPKFSGRLKYFYILYILFNIRVIILVYLNIFENAHLQIFHKFFDIGPQ